MPTAHWAESKRFKKIFGTATVCNAIICPNFFSKKDEEKYTFSIILLLLKVAEKQTESGQHEVSKRD